MPVLDTYTFTTAANGGSSAFPLTCGASAGPLTTGTAPNDVDATEAVLGASSLLWTGENSANAHLLEYLQADASLTRADVIVKARLKWPATHQASPTPDVVVWGKLWPAGAPGGGTNNGFAIGIHNDWFGIRGASILRTTTAPGATISLLDETGQVRAFAANPSAGDVIRVEIRARPHPGGPNGVMISGSVYNETTSTLLCTLTFSSSSSGFNYGRQAGIPAFATAQNVPVEWLSFEVSEPDPEYTVAAMTGYQTVRLRRGVRSVVVPVAITRTGGHTASTTLSVSGLPANVTGTVTTQPGTGNSGVVEFSAAGGAAIDLTGTVVTVTADDGTTQKTQNLTLYVHPSTRPTNAYGSVPIGSSTVAGMGASGQLATKLATRLGGTNAWTSSHANAAQSGSQVDHWTVGSTVNSFVHEAVNAAFLNNAFEVYAVYPYSNNAGSYAWGSLGPIAKATLQYLCDLGLNVVLMPAHGRFDLAASSTGTIAGTPTSTSIQLTVSTGSLTVGDVGKFLVITRDANNQMARKITAVNTGTSTVTTEAFDVFAPANGQAWKISAATSYDNIVLYNAAIQDFAEGGADPVANGTHGTTVVWRDTGILLTERDYISTVDSLHASTDGLLIHSDRVVNVVSAYLLNAASVSLTPPAVTVIPGATQAFTASVSGFTAWGGTAWPANLIPGDWSVESGGGSINSGGVYTAPGGIGSATIRHTLDYNAAKYGESSVSVAYPAPENPDADPAGILGLAALLTPRYGTIPLGGPVRKAGGGS